MKNIFRSCVTFLITITVYVACYGQGQWVWVGGSSTLNALATYGTQGVPSVNNIPPGLYQPGQWRDNAGNIWLYGGLNNNGPVYADMWKFNTKTYEWTWIKGNGLNNVSPVYGTQGSSNIANTPGSRTCPITWVTSSGMFYLYGGSNENGQRHADLWRYNPSNNQWTWVDGSQFTNQIGINGTKGVPGNINNPGSRSETNIAWTENNNLWFFGGQMNTSSQYYNDVWRYNITTGQWTWVDGNNILSPNAAPVHGTMGLSTATNDPGARNAYAHWQDANGNVWLIGGRLAAQGPVYNDVWKYDINSLNWTWMYGSNTANVSGVYSGTCFFNNNNQPVARTENKATAIDKIGNVWMFGGANINSLNNYNDLWIFRSDSLMWKLMFGDGITNTNANYGVPGVASPTNIIPSRDGAVMFYDDSCNVFIFGGTSRTFFSSCYNDLWKFVPDTACVPCTPTIQTNAAVAVNTDTICAGQFILYADASSGNPNSWQWIFSGGSPSSSSAQNPGPVTYSNPGLYYTVLMISNGQTQDSTAIPIYVSAVPSPAIGNDTTVCDTSNYTISAASNFISYLWNTGDTTSSITVNTSGTYWVQCNNGNCISTDTVTVSFVPCNLPIAFVSASDTLLCEKGSIDFSDFSTGAPTQWMWYFTGAVPSTSTLQNPTGIFYANYGTYNVSLVVTNAAGSDSTFLANYIHVVPNPPQPIVTYTNNMLCCSPANTYQWYLNNQPIANAIGQCYTPTVIGNYYVIISDSNNCNSASNSFNVTAMMSEGTIDGVHIFPNPASSMLYISIINVYSGTVIIEVSDIVGRVIKLTSTDKNTTSLSTNIDIENLEPGKYFVRLKARNSIFEWPFIKK